MAVIKGKFFVASLLLFIGVALCAGSSFAVEDSLLSIQGTCPDIVSGTAFNITLRISNTTDNQIITFDRVTLMYVNPDMSFSGPVESAITRTTLNPGAVVNRTVSFTVNTSQPSGTIVPIIINLFRLKLSTDKDSLRGTVIVGAKIQ